jgi:hypothetical protein
MKPTTRIRFALVAATAVAGVTLTATRLDAWGEAGHKMIGLAAAQALPADMPAFFRDAAAQLSYLNPEPDRWKDRSERDRDPALEAGTSPEHFMDMDMLPLDRMNTALAAPNRFAYEDSVRAAGLSPAVVGLLPFRILELSQTLRLEFRLWRAATDDATKHAIEARIINDAGILGHYVADGSNPLHTSRQYNGWTGPNPNGYATDTRTHSRFESIYVTNKITIADITPLISRDVHPITNIRASTIAYLNESRGQVERLYQIDKAAPFGAETTAPENKAFTAQRLAAGAQMLRDLWYSAYVASAVP